MGLRFSPAGVDRGPASTIRGPKEVDTMESYPSHIPWPPKWATPKGKPSPAPVERDATEPAIVVAVPSAACSDLPDWRLEWTQEIAMIFLRMQNCPDLDVRKRLESLVSVTPKNR